jgi:hypothetical protein
MHTYTIGMITCMVSSRINLPSIWHLCQLDMLWDSA